jgi:hypothetical protein
MVQDPCSTKEERGTRNKEQGTRNKEGGRRKEEGGRRIGTRSVTKVSPTTRLFSLVIGG